MNNDVDESKIPLRNTSDRGRDDVADVNIENLQLPHNHDVRRKKKKNCRIM